MKPVEAPLPKFLAARDTREWFTRAVRRDADHRPFNGRSCCHWSGDCRFVGWQSCILKLSERFWRRTNCSKN